MKHIGAYILLDLAASPFCLPVAQVWQALCDSVLGVLSSSGLRVSVVGYSNVANVLLEGVTPEEAVSWTPPREEAGLSNLNLALIQCLSLLKRSPPGGIPFILLASGGLVTDEPTLLSRRWARMTAGIPRYALLTGRSFPGIPFPAFGAPAHSVYSLDGRDLDRLARDIPEDLMPVFPSGPGSENEGQEPIIYPKTITIMENQIVGSQVPATASGANLPMTKNLFHGLGIFDDETCALLTREPGLLSRFLPSAKQKLIDELHLDIIKVNSSRYVEACRVLGEAQIRALSEQVNDFLIRSAVDFRAETVKQVLRRHAEAMRSFEVSLDELLEMLSAKFDKIERIPHPILRKQYEKSLESTTDRIFTLYNDMGKYLSDFLNARVSEPCLLKP